MPLISMHLFLSAGAIRPVQSRRLRESSAWAEPTTTPSAHHPCRAHYPHALRGGGPAQHGDPGGSCRRRSQGTPPLHPTHPHQGGGGDGWASANQQHPLQLFRWVIRWPTGWTLFFCCSQSVVLVRRTKKMLYQANTIHTYTGGRDVLFYSVVLWKRTTVSFCFSQSVLLVRLEPKMCYTKITQSTPIQEDRMSVLFCSIMEKEGEGCFLTMAVWRWTSRSEHQTHGWKVVGLNPCRSSGRISFSRVSFLCRLLFRYLFHRVTTVARKRSQSFCRWKCRWQITAKHLTYVALHEMTWCMVVWCTQNAPRWQQFHVAPAMSALLTTPLQCIFKNTLWKASHSCRITCQCSVWE